MSESQTAMQVEQVAARLQQAFYDRYGRAARWVVAAPGRVNLIGEHVDYNDGFVLPMAIERYVVIAAAACEGESLGARDGVARVASLTRGEPLTLRVTPPAAGPSGGWGNYIEGVIAGFLARGVTIGAFDALVDSTVPVGSGLSSSAALEVAMATLLEQVTGRSLPPRDKALLCQAAEHGYAGVPCGIMDQFSSVFGRADELMLLDCRSQQIRGVRFPTHEVTVLVTNSNVQHELAGGEYAQRRAACDRALARLGQGSWREVTPEFLAAREEVLEPTERRRARHVVTEIARTTAAAEAFARGDWPRVGELMYASHASLRDDYEVSCRELDLLVELAAQIGAKRGVLGSRMTGGGFGGCTVSLVETRRAEAIAAEIGSQYEQASGIRPELFTSWPARGAHVVRG